MTYLPWVLTPNQEAYVISAVFLYCMKDGQGDIILERKLTSSVVKTTVRYKKAATAKIVFHEFIQHISEQRKEIFIFPEEV